MSGEKMVRRQVLALVFIPMLLLSALLGYFGSRDYQLLYDGVMAQGIAGAEHLASMAEFGLATSNTAQLEEAARSMQRRNSLGAVAARIYDARGEALVVTGTDHQRPGAIPAVAGPCGETKNFYFFCAPVLMQPLPVEQFAEFGNASEPTLLGHVEIALSVAQLKNQRAFIISGYAVVLGLVFSFGVIFARRAERALARPISELRDAVERVGQGELSLRVQECADGELLTLQRGFNAMASRIESSHAEQERRIAEATARLRQTLSELEQRNDELNAEKLRAEASSHAKSRFLAVMSHEIRTPLAGMIGMLTLLKKSGLNAEQTGYVHHVAGAAGTLRQLIDEILDYSRIEAGKMALFNDPIRISRVVEEVITMFAPSAAEKGLEFVVHAQNDLPDAVMGDALRLRQVLINLTANAIKFTERGFVRIEVSRVGGQDAQPRFLFAVEDSGIGIPAEKTAQVFESFTQVDSGPTRRYSGSGLGTTISRELVLLMGGEIGFSSKAGEGSRFWFELSLARDVSALPETKPLLDKRVAVIEREPHARAALVTALESMGAEVIASDGNDPLPRDGRAFHRVLVCEEGLDPGQLQAVMPPREMAECRCQVLPVNGTAQPGYTCHFIKPVTRARLMAQWDISHHLNDESAMSPERSSLKILVAEDDDINARVIEVLLKRLGHVALRVRDGREALDVLAREPFDVAFLDIRMPEVDGTGVAEQWRAHEREAGGRLPLIALTANGSNEDMARCHEVGIDEFLIKPVSEQQLADVLERAVRRDNAELPAATSW